MSDQSDDPQERFESIKQFNQYGVEYWSARELMPLLGYNKWEHFDEVIRKAQIACAQVGQDVDNHFPPAGKKVALGSGARRTIKDFYLSRLACYLVAQNGDPRKTEIAEAQLYFAVQTRRQELNDQLTNQEKRFEVRTRILGFNKGLNQAAYDAGVQSEMFGVFHDAGYKGLYNGLGVQGIKEKKGIGKNEDILDRMGRVELAANEFRITQTEEKLRNERIQGQSNAIQAHHDVGKKVRQTIQEIGGTMPEDLPPEPSIKPLIDRQRRAQKKLNAAKDGTAEQDNLF